MIWIDAAVITIVIISASLGWMRGAAREVLSFGTWIMALALAWWLHRDIADLLTTQVAQPAVRTAIAFTGLFFIGLIIGTLGSAMITAWIQKTGLTRLDRGLGLLFGMGRGLVIIGMVVFLVALTPVPNTHWWQESGLIPHIHVAAQWVLTHIPITLRDQIKRI